MRIKFDEELENDLKEDDLIIMIDQNKVDFVITKLDSFLYSIFIEIDNIEKSSILYINITKKLHSKNNSLLNITNFKHQIYVTDDMIESNRLKMKINDANDHGSKGSASTFSIALLIAVLNFDFSFAGDYLSTAEIFYAMYLFNAPINPVLCEFLISLRVHKRFPNFMLSFVDELGRINIDKKYRRLGYNTQMAFVNLGIQITSLAAISCFWVIIY